MESYFPILIIFTIIFSFVLVVPLTGILVRFRANYNPKGLQLDNEGGVQPHTGPVVTSFFSMLTRVYRLEGVPGLYKGLMPTLLSTFTMSLLIVLFLDGPARAQHHRGYNGPSVGIVSTLLYSAGAMLLGLPTAIITYRSITTPHKLPYFNPIKSLRILLTPTERSKPWILYLTPGLLATEVSHVAFVLLILDPLRRFLLPDPNDMEAIRNVSYFKLTIYFVVTLVSTGILCPLEVIGTRLAIQRNHAGGYNSVNQEVDASGDGELPEYAGAEEDVIGLRSDEDPYLGLADCAKRIIDEEGWQSLYRAWWITMLGILLSPM